MYLEENERLLHPNPGRIILYMNPSGLKGMSYSSRKEPRPAEVPGEGGIKQNG